MENKHSDLNIQNKQESDCKRDFKEYLFLGSPLLDIRLNCSQHILDTYGLKSDNCIRETDKQDILFQSLFNNPQSQMSAGGSALNSARIAKWILQNRGRVSFSGCVGQDDYAKTILDCLEAEGVEAVLIPIVGESTGICACLLNSEGNRSMCTRLGAAQHFAEPHLHEENVRERLRTANCIFVVGFYFSHSPDVILALSETCSDSQVFSLSLSAEYVCRDHAKTLSKVLHRVDVLFSNKAEAEVLAQTLGWGNISVADIARNLAIKNRPPSCKPRIVVITQGPNPMIVASGAEYLRSFAIPGNVKVVDGVGCGDAVAGAFLAIFVLTGDVSLAAKTAILAAVEIAQVEGCRPTKTKLYPSEIE